MSDSGSGKNFAGFASLIFIAGSGPLVRLVCKLFFRENEEKDPGS